MITVIFAAGSRLSLVAAALTPFLAPEGTEVFFFFSFMMLFFFGGAIAGCSWNSWIKDIVPEKIMGSYLASRLSAATALSAALSLVAAFGIDELTTVIGEPSGAFGIVFLAAAACGLYGVILLTKVPEPRMLSEEDSSRWLHSLLQPVKDTNFRRLLIFSGAWSFTVIMSGAFFAVYMLNRIGTSMFSASGLNMGMRRMSAFPYEILKKTTRSARSGVSSLGLGPRRRER